MKLHRARTPFHNQEPVKGMQVLHHHTLFSREGTHIEAIIVYGIIEVGPRPVLKKPTLEKARGLN